jgi:tight adherence protein C
MDIYVIIGLAFLSVSLLSFTLLYLVSTRNRRLKARLEGLQDEAGTTARSSTLSRAITERSLGILGKDSEEISDTRYILARAGYFNTQAVFDYYWLRLIGAILLGLSGLGVGLFYRIAPLALLAVTLLGAILGAYLPWMWIMRRIHKRAQEIRIAVPNMLDLLVVCVEAGLSLSAAIQRLALETKLTSRALSDELHIVTQEILIGRPKSDAFHALAARTGVEELGSLAVTLAQTDRLGTSIAKSLRVLAEGMRFKRRQQAEEQANKASVKLVFPLVFLIFPELMVVLIGPAVINFVTILKDVAH